MHYGLTVQGIFQEHNHHKEQGFAVLRLQATLQIASAEDSGNCRNCLVLVL
jgi:hypothetical protein